MKSGYANLQGASFHYEMTGTGKVLVLLHGFSFDSSLWDVQTEALAAKFRVLKYDLRGFGKSASSEVCYTHAGDLKALLEFLHIESAYLLGLSLGGGAAINFALTYPDIARGLILVAPSLGGFQWSEKLTSVQNSLLTISKEKGVTRAREIWLRQAIFSHGMKRKDIADKLRAMVGGYSGWHWLHPDLGRPMNPPAILRLKEIRIPTLIIAGDADARDQLQIVDILEKEISGARKIVFQNVGHVVNLEVPGQFNAEVLEFLGNIENNP